MSGSDDSKQPDWQRGQQNSIADSEESTSPSQDDQTSSYKELLAQAKEFLQDDTIRSATRENQITFLEQKGLKRDDIEKLLDNDSDAKTDSELKLRTVHDSAARTPDEQKPIAASTDSTFAQGPQPLSSQRDAPPIITYPEFLLKPQKPPPLVTLQRLMYATYGIAGLSALTYGASKYLVEPMLEILSDARHDLASKTLEDLEKLNQKLESSVSHIPYSATLAALKASKEHNDDLESVDSDPTEFFHRDIATQTSPRLSRSSSSSSPTKKTPLDVTNQQASRLKALHTTLESLVSSVDPTPDPFLPSTSTKQLHDTVAGFQTMLDKLETTYNPFRSDYNSIYSSLSSTSTSGKGDNNEAAKFKAEIRSLKGAFLSSRNFPAARPSGYTPASAR